jgi:pilus assembly protein CpaE
MTKAGEIMAQALRLVVFNAEEDFGPILRSELLGFDGVKIVAEVDEPALLTEAVQRFPVDLLIVHLDPFPEQILPAVKELLVRRPDLPCFGISESQDGTVVLAALRAGFREFLTKPLVSDELETALNKMMAQKPARHQHGQLISVIGTVGGVGGTTLAVNTAVELAQQKAGRVALVDMDFRFGQVATFLDLQPNFTVADLCDTPEQLDPRMIEKAVIKHSTGVEVLARPHQFGQAEQISAAHAASVVSALQEFYDFVVIDGPMRFDSGGRVVLEMSDIVLLVLQLIVPSVRNADRILQELGRQGFNLDRLKLVVNRVGHNNGSLEVEQVEATLNRKTYACISDDWQAASTAINMGEPLCMAAARSKARLDIEALARRLCPESTPVNGTGDPKKAASSGIFSRIFSTPKNE